MSAGIRQVAGVTKARLEKYLLQVKATDLSGDLSEQLQTYEHQRSQIEAAINLLSDYERQWLQLFANLTPEQEKKERDLMAKAQETGGFLNRLEGGREQLIILQNYVLQLRVAIANQTESDARTRPNSTVSSSPLRLPKIELRRFDGNSTNCPVFRDWYLSTIDNQPISDQQKIAYFASCMVGPAKELIEAYQLQNPSYSDIVKRVKERYANNEVIVQQLYAQLERIPRIQEGRQVRTLVEDIERILELLLHQGETINNRMIQREIEKKLPRWILQDLERKKLEDDSWDVTKLRKFLSNVALTQEAVHRMTPELGGVKISEKPLVKGSKPFTQGKSTSALSIVAERKAKSVPCAFCKMPHFANQCRKYSTRDQRIERCRQLSLCFRCLKPSHRTKECRNGETIIEETSSTPKPPTSVVASVSNQVTARNKGEATLLMCVHATAADQLHRKREKVLVFIDTGSQRSFITERLATKLSLPFSQIENLNLMAFATQRIKPYRSMRTTVSLKTVGGNWQPFDVSTVKQITHNVQYAPSQLLKHHFIENWASLPTVACGDPEILIGMDQLSKIMEVSTSKPVKSGFSIYETKLGPIIAGHGR
uniref:DUF1758 domain-containing protein n=1 Tax=Ascaris lumbricoides TaxID=6252 RepID=A0A0M3ID01_ASCLU